MGKKYHTYRTSGGGERLGKQTAYEVSSGAVIGYNVEETGFFKKKFNYKASGGRYPINKDSLVDLWAEYSSGSGDLNLKTNGETNTFCIYGDAKGFTEEIQRAIDNAPS